jgi:hypothetical protein
MWIAWKAINDISRIFTSASLMACCLNDHKKFCMPMNNVTLGKQVACKEEMSI